MPFVETETHGTNYLNPLPDLIDGQEEHEVEAIIAHKRQVQRYLFHMVKQTIEKVPHVQGKRLESMVELFSINNVFVFIHMCMEGGAICRGI